MPDRAPRRSRLVERAMIALFVLTLPVSIPLSAITNAIRGARLRRARAAAARPRGDWTADDVRSARAHVLESLSMASGADEVERILELTLTRGERVFVAGPEALRLTLELTARGIEIHESVTHTGRSLGCINALLWAAVTGAMVAVGLAIASGREIAWVFAAGAVLACIAVLRM